MKSSYASKLCIHAYMLASLHSVIYRGEHEKYIFATTCKYGKFTCDSVCPQDQLLTVKRQKVDYPLFAVLPNILQNVLSKTLAC